MSIFNFVSDGKTFSIKAPTGVTEEQARAIFEQQNSTGSLTGIKVGGALSAATQAAGGLQSAASQLSQQAAGVAGGLPAGTDLNSITASIGAAGQGAASQVTASLQGGSAAFNSLTTGAAGATATASKLLSVGSTVLSNPLTGAAALPTSLATQAVRTISGAVRSTPANAVNAADIAKQGPALGKLGNLSQADVQGTLAQTAKSVGQTPGKVTNALGIGKFGFNAGQLERAGLVKPGTAAAFLAKGQNDLVSVLKSPTVWTGKDGVKGLSNLLGNEGLQNKVQQGLMSTGVAQLKSVGLPTDKLSPQALAGVATNAAKSVSDTVAWAKDSPSLPAAAKSALGAAAAGAAFAVGFINKKIDAPVLQETKPTPAEDTVNSETVDAAGQRVVGDQRVPDTTASGTGADAKAKIDAFVNLVRIVSAGGSAVSKTLAEYQAATSISLDQWNALNDEWQAIKALFNSRVNELKNAAYQAVDTLPRGSDRNLYTRYFNQAIALAEKLITTANELTKQIKDLANKVVGAGEIPV